MSSLAYTADGGTLISLVGYLLRRRRAARAATIRVVARDVSTATRSPEKRRVLDVGEVGQHELTADGTSAARIYTGRQAPRVGPGEGR